MRTPCLTTPAGLAKCREQRISGLAVGGYRIVAKMVDPLQPRKVCERRRLPPAEAAGEQAVAADKVVDQVADLPVGAGGGAGPLPVSYTHLRAHETRHDLV